MTHDPEDPGLIGAGRFGRVPQESAQKVADESAISEIHNFLSRVFSGRPGARLGDLEESARAIVIHVQEDMTGEKDRRDLARLIVVAVSGAVAGSIMTAILVSHHLPSP